MSNTILRSNLAALLSGLALTGLLCLAAFSVPHDGLPAIGLVIALVVGAGAALVARRSWEGADVDDRDEARYWLRKSIPPIGFLIFLGAVDLLLAVLFEPDVPLFKAATSHVGFLITLLFAPIALAPIACAIRALFQVMLGVRRKVG